MDNKTVAPRGRKGTFWFGRRRCGLRAFWLCAPPACLIAVVSCVNAQPTVRAALIRGTVADEAGMPVAGASIQINRYEGTRIDAEHLATKTDSEGRFEFHLPVERGGQLIIKEVWAEHPGFLRITVTGRYALVPSKEQTFDFVMRPGEILAGKVNKPLTPIERRTGVKPEQEQYVLRISGSEFQQMQMTEKGGAFEVYVPKGEYLIEVVGTSIRSDVIASGTKNLVLMPEDVVISNEVLATAFDALWKDMDVHYSYFAYKPDVDWSQLGKTYREQAVAAKSLGQFLQTLKEMLSELEDMHIWIETDSQVIGTHQTPWEPNWNPRVLKAALREPTKCGNFAIVGTTIPDGFGCLLINQQSAATPEAVQQTVAAIQQLHDVPGFIVDLRGGCSGGDERFAQQVAQAFCDRPVVYARHKFRNGAAHNAFGEESERVLQPSERPFTKPVVCLIGKKCMSSGEAFVLMMKALPQVVTIGGPTRGASGNPAKFALPGLNVNVWYSRWVSLLPNGEVFEGRGVKPDVEVARPPSAYQGNNDPTWEEGLKVLHHSTAPRQ